MDKIFYFHGNDTVDHWKPSYDLASFDESKGFMALADGVIRQKQEEVSIFPDQFASEAVSRTFVTKAEELAPEFDMDHGGMNELLHELNKEIANVNTQFGYDPNDKDAYWMGECVGGVVTVRGNVLHYGILEDCYVNVLRGDKLEDVVKMDHHIMKAKKFADQLVESSPTLQFEDVWCKQLRNSPDAQDVNGDLIGWGSFNGQEDASLYWQIGSVELIPGDVIILVSNGMLPLFEHGNEFNPRIEEIMLKEDYQYGVSLQKELSKLITDMIAEGYQNLHREKTLLRTIWRG